LDFVTEKQSLISAAKAIKEYIQEHGYKSQTYKKFIARKMGDGNEKAFLDLVVCYDSPPAVTALSGMARDSSSSQLVSLGSGRMSAISATAGAVSGVGVSMSSNNSVMSFDRHTTSQSSSTIAHKMNELNLRSSTNTLASAVTATTAAATSENHPNHSSISITARANTTTATTTSSSSSIMSYFFSSYLTTPSSNCNSNKSTSSWRVGEFPSTSNTTTTTTFTTTAAAAGTGERGEREGDVKPIIPYLNICMSTQQSNLKV
jgi:hypothetical protein